MTEIKPDETETDDDLFCTCDYPDWRARVWIGGDLVVDEVVSDIEADIAAQSFRHADLVQTEAIDKDKHWRAEIRCPKCGGGTVMCYFGLADIHGFTGLDAAPELSDQVVATYCAAQSAGIKPKIALHVLAPLGKVDPAIDDLYSEVTVPDNGFSCGHPVAGHEHTHEFLRTNIAAPGMPFIHIHAIFCADCARKVGLI